MRLDAIVIKPSDPEWPDSFRSQATILAPLMNDLLTRPLEHIGSTSIPGMPAKPIIDMLAVIDDYESFGPVMAELEKVGWIHAPEPGDEERRKWSLCFPTVELRSHHLHVVEHASTGWRDWLLFRDYLRGHPDEAERYSTLKRDLASADANDRDRYRSGKAPLIRELLDHARVWKRDGLT
jgi:GrpB-like predicted nucleotidyltransferase (UPF0157 family)